MAMASASAAGGKVPDNHGGTVPDKSTKTAHDAQKLLKHSKGRMRIRLEDCGPATFNRFGQPLSGRHQCSNMTRILQKEGFATYRYYAAYAHTPPKDDPLQVYRHGKAMADKDRLLPRFEKKPLYGIFGKTHLMSGCLKIKQGDARYMNEQGEVTTQPMLVPAEEAELREVMQNGLFMEVWEYEFVVQNLEAFKALMASDNFDAGYGLAEDEQSLCARMFLAMKEVRIPPGMSHWTVVLQETKKFAGKAYREEDLEHFWEFVKTTPQLSMDYWRAVHRIVCDPAVFEVPPEVFKQCFNKMDPKYVFTRLAFVVRAYCSSTDPKKNECIQVGSRSQGNAVKKTDVEAWQKIPPKAKTKIEEYIKEIMLKYWGTPFGKDESGAGVAHDWEQDAGGSEEDSLRETGAFLVRVTKLLLAEKTRASMIADAESMQREFYMLEQKLRKGFRTCDPAVVYGLCYVAEPPPACSEPRAADLRAVAQDARAGPSSAPPLTFDAEGTVVANTASRVRAAGIEDGCTVELQQQSAYVKKGAIGVVTEITCKGVKVLWAEEFLREGVEAGEAFISAPGHLKLIEDAALKSKKRKVLKVEPESNTLPEGLPSWSVASDQQSSETFKSSLVLAMYVLMVGKGPGPEELRLVPAEEGASRQVVVAKKLAVNTLTIVPFGTNFVQMQPGMRRPAGAVTLEISLAASSDGPKHRFHVVPDGWTAGDDAVDPAIPPAVNVWEWLPSVEPSQQQRAKLKCVKRTCKLPIASTCPSISGIPKVEFQVIVPFYTNDKELLPGTRLWGEYKP